MKYIYPDGTAELFTMGKGDSIEIPRGIPHQFRAITGDADIMEVSTRHFDEDSYRVERGDQAVDFKPGDMFKVKESIEVGNHGDLELYSRNSNSEEAECFVLTELLDLPVGLDGYQEVWRFDLYRSESDAKTKTHHLNDSQLDDRISSSQAHITVAKLEEYLLHSHIQRLNYCTKCIYCDSPVEHSGKYYVCTECFRVQDDS